MIKGVVFDIGGVLFTNGTAEAIKKISKRFGIDEQKVREILMGELGERYRRGEITREEFWESARRLWGDSVDVEEASKIWHECYKPRKDVFELLEELKRSGYRLFFLSDSTEERNEFLERKYGFLRYFEDGVFSHEVGMKKPERRIYELLIRKTNMKASELVFIDDRKEFLEPARKLGMKTIHFRDGRELRERLKKWVMLK